MKCSHGYEREKEYCPTCDNRSRVLPLEIELTQLRAEVAELRKQEPAAAVPKGWRFVKSPITEEMHIAAVKVLHRATGVDRLPQRMLDAMLAAAPAPEDVK